jgi:hypothetical protein
MTRIVLVLGTVLVCGLAGSGEAASIRKVCKQYCGAAIANCEAAALMFGGGAYGPGANLIGKGCKKGVLKYCRKNGTAMCDQLASCVGAPVCASTVTTTTVRSGTTTLPHATTTTTTLPDVGDYQGGYNFNGQLKTDTCGVDGVPDVLFALLNIESTLDLDLHGQASQTRGDVFFSQVDVTGTATWPTWTTTSDDSCAIGTLDGRCGSVRTTMTGLPNYSFEDAPHEVPGSIEFIWSSPNCTSLWEGTWGR